MSTWQPGPGDPTYQPGQPPTYPQGQPGHPGAQPPRKPRPRAVWWLLPIGLFLAAIAVGVGGIIAGASSFVGTEASAPMDDAPHELTLDDAEPKTLWVPEGASGSCRVSDEDGTELTLDPVGGEATRSFGSGSYRAQYTFDPSASTVVVQCRVSDAFGEPEVQIGPEIEVGRTVGSVLLGVFGGGLLALLALVAAIVLGIRTAQGAPRSTA
jgi:hypothetical protein